MSEVFGLNKGLEFIRDGKDAVLLLNTLKRLPQLICASFPSEQKDFHEFISTLCQLLSSTAKAPDTNDEMLFAITDTIPTILSVINSPNDCECIVKLISSVT